MAQPRRRSPGEQRAPRLVIVHGQGAATAAPPTARQSGPDRAGEGAPAQADRDSPARPSQLGGESSPPAAAAAQVRVVVAERQAPIARGRDASGRFVRKAGEDGGQGEAARAAGVLSGVGERLSDAVREMGDGGEADPSIKAFNEIAQPLSRGFGKIFGSGQERWYRRFWREMREKRREDQAATKVTQRTLKNIERKPVGGSGGSGLIGLLLAPLAALLGRLLGPLAFLSRLGGLLTLLGGAVTLLKRLVPAKVRGFFGGDGRQASRPGPAGPIAGRGRAAPRLDRGGLGGEAGRAAGAAGRAGIAGGIVRRLPVIGALAVSLGAAVQALGVLRSDDSAEDKSRAVGRAGGSVAGSLGGMWAGAKMGAMVGALGGPVGAAIGSVVGGAAGAFFGDKAGQVVGEKVGVWVNDLRQANITRTIADGWHLATDFLGSLWQQATDGLSERWSSVTAYMSESWATVSAGASALWAGVAGNISAGWASLSSTLSTIWSTAVGEMQKGWGAALVMAAKGWEAFSSFAGKASDWIKDKTGVDPKKVYSDVEETAGGLIDGARNAVSTTWDRAALAASSAANSVKSGARAVADATGATTLVRSVRNAASYAKGKNALRHAMADAGIADPNEQAAFMAQMDHESAGFTIMQESFDYRSAERLMAVGGSARRHGKQAVEAAIAKGPESVAELMYGGRMGNTSPGDAYAFRGRGFVQLTGRDNYEAAGRALGVDLLNNPDLAADPEMAAKVATWYWKSRDGLSEAGKRGDVAAVTQKINGGTNGLSDRMTKTEKYLAEARDGGLTVSPSAPAVGEQVAMAPVEQVRPGDAWAAAQPPAPVVPPPMALAVGRPAVVPSAPAVASPPAVPSVQPPAIATISEAPSIAVPMGEGGKSSRPPVIAQDVPRDLPDRRIAHVVTGAYSGMG
ncbi:Chitinase class I [compost metagenome]